MLRCPACDQQTPLKDATVRLTVEALMNHYHRNSGSNLPIPPLTPQVLAAISTSTREFLLSFAQEYSLEEKETEDLLKSFKRTTLEILCRLSKEDIRARISDVELAQLLYFKIQDSLSTAATRHSSNPKQRRQAQDGKVLDGKQLHIPDDHTNSDHHETEVYSKIMSSLGRVKTLGSSLSASFATTLEDSFEVETEDSGNEAEITTKHEREPIPLTLPSHPPGSSHPHPHPHPHAPTTAASVFAAAATTVSTFGSPLASFFQNLTTHHPHPTASTSVPASPMKPQSTTSVTPIASPPSPSVSPVPPKNHQHNLSPLSPVSPSPEVGKTSSTGGPITPTVKTETPTTLPTSNKRSLFESGNMETDIRGILSHTESLPSAENNGLQYTETAPKLLGSKIVSMAQNQKKLAEKFIGYTVKKSSEASGAAAKLMDTRGQALKKKATTKVQSMFVGKPETLSSAPARSGTHFVSTAEPCILCNQLGKDPNKKFLPLNCMTKHTGLVCIPCCTSHLSLRWKDNQSLICPVPDCGNELVPKDIDALKNIGMCDDSLQYKMHMEKLKTESRKKVVIEES